MENHQKVQVSFIPFLRVLGFWRSLLLLAIMTGCSNLEVEKAFKGDLRPGKANKVIGDYCRSCHIHKDFHPPSHVSQVRSLYKRTFFRKARECRFCHYIKKDWIHNQHQRKTRMPEDANRGKFKKFEKKQMRWLRKS